MGSNNQQPQPASRSINIPTWASRWVGIRSQPPKPPKIWVPYVWSFIGAFCALAVLQAVFGHASYFVRRGVPPLVASYGASAVLCFATIEAPLAQPRALIGGHFLSALTGVIVCKIFSLNALQDDDPVPRLAWLASSLAAAIAIVVMQLTKTTHPPAGATALLPVVEPSINRIGWYFLPVVLLSSVLVLVIALLNNNIQRRYPTFWWTPPKPAKSQLEGRQTSLPGPGDKSLVVEEEEKKSQSEPHVSPV